MKPFRLTLMALALALAAAPAAWAAGPSFSCAKPAGQAERLVCEDAELTQLDREVARLYGLASTGPEARRHPELKAMQRGWLKGRDDCWKRDDPRRCVRDEYALRIAELRALPDARREDRRGIAVGPLPLRCPTVDGEVLKTAQGSVVLDHQLSASGARYGGRLADGDYLLWNKGREFRLERPGLPAADCTDAAAR